MANLYYNNAAVDYAWDTLGNWWSDASFTTPALALPTTGDTVYLTAGMTGGPSTSVTLAHIYVDNCTVFLTGAIGDATFTNASHQNSTITGNATFNESSNYDSTVTGNATFNGTSQNSYGTITGDATFNDTSFNSGTVSGDAVFNGTSLNYSQVDGSSTFNDSSSNTIGLGGTSVTFNDSSSNTSPSGGVYAPIVTFNDNSTNYGTIGSYSYPTTATFNGSSANYFYVNGVATYNDYSFSNGFEAGDDGITFNDYSYNNGYAIFSLGSFNDYSYNSGTVGSCTFNNYSYNSGYIGDATIEWLSPQNATFNDFSYNSGSTTGTATFNGVYAVGRIGSGTTYGGQMYVNMTLPNPQPWDNYASYGQGNVVSEGGFLWLLANTGGWTVGGRPSLGYGWQKLSTGGGVSAPQPINLAQLVGLPPFIQL
jgi:hypothetical protein